MTDPRQPKDKELSRVYSEGAWPEPRRQIDEAILAASRRAARARHPILYRWGVPFALAATVVLGVSLALMVSEQESGRELKDLFSRASDEPAAGRRTPQAKREIVTEPKRDAVPAPKSEPKIEAAPKAGPAPKELFASPMGPTKPASPPAAAPGAAKAPTVPGAQALRRPAPAPDPQRADRVRRELEQLEENRQARQAAAPREPLAETQASPAAPSAGLSDVRGMVAATGTVARSPDVWLDDIRKLKAQGRTPDAERELAEFRKRYPDYRVPDDLR